MDQDRILVTGATGFVGRHVVSHLMRAGRPLTLAVRNVATCPASWQDPLVTLVETREIETSGMIEKVMTGATTVVHLAGLAHLQGGEAQNANRFTAANAVATERLVEAAAAGGVRTFIHLSSLAVVTGNASAQIVNDETHHLPATPYGRSKRAAEDHVQWLAERDVFAISLRPPLIVGAEAKGNWGALQRLAASGLPLPFGRVRNRRSLIGVGTVARTVGELCSHIWPANKSGAYCISDSGTVSLAEIVTELRIGMGRSARVMPFPPSLLAGMAKLARQEQRAAGLLGDLEVDASRFATTFGFPEAPDVRAAIRESGRQYHPIHSGHRQNGRA